MTLNGRLLGTSLAYIPGTSRRLLTELIPQTIDLRAAFAARFGRPLVITDAYRTFDEQVDVFRRYYTTTYQPGRPTRVWGGVVYWQRPGYPSAAVPGTSNHGWARALDLGSGVNDSLTSDEHLWMRRNGSTYGWEHPAWAHDHVSSNGTDEPWHFEASGVVTTVAAETATPRPIPTAPTPPTPPAPLTPTATSQEDDMKDILIALYLKTTGRMPDPVGASAYISAVARGELTWEQVHARLEASEESKAFAARTASEAARNQERLTNGAGWFA
jgi:hypothetical protein